MKQKFSRLVQVALTLALFGLLGFALRPIDLAVARQIDPVPAQFSPQAWVNIQAQIKAASASYSQDDRDLQPVQKLGLPVTRSQSYFGSAVAVDGDIAVIGGYYVDYGAIDQGGAAYVFYRNTSAATADTWSLFKVITAADAGNGAHFGWAVAISGDTLAVSAEKIDFSEFGNSQVYIYRRDHGGSDKWGLVKSFLSPSAPTANFMFGKALALHGNLLAVGAPQQYVVNDIKGAVFLFNRNLDGADNWGFTKMITATDEGPYDQFGWDVDLTQDILAVGSKAADVNGQADRGAAYIYYRNDGGADNWGPRVKITATDTITGNQFGTSVSLHGDTLGVGAPQHNGGQGAAYIFQRNQGGGNLWGQVQKILPSSLTGVGEFGNDVSLDRDTLLIGSHLTDVAAQTARGAAYVFERNQGGVDNWGQVHQVLADDGAGGDRFGNQVALSGNTLVIGAWLADVGLATDNGAAYVFYLTGDHWAEIVRLGDTISTTQMGWSVSLFNDTLAVGAPKASLLSAPEAGRVYLFRRNSSDSKLKSAAPNLPGLSLADNWGLIDVVTADDAAAGDFFGLSISMYDDTLVVGAPQRGGGAGGVYVFFRNQGGADNWGQKIVLTGTSGSLFGTSVSLDRDLLAIGAPGATGSGKGDVYLHERNQGGLDAWGEVKHLSAPIGSGNFGYDVALAADRLLAGMPYADFGATNAGSVYLYERNQDGAGVWGEVKQFLAQTPAADDHFGFAVGVSGDTVAIGAPDKDVTSTNTLDAGQVYIYYGYHPDYAGSWARIKTLTLSDYAASDRFGYALDLDGDRVLIGAPRRRIGDRVNQGAGYLFERNFGGAEGWGLVQRLTTNSGLAGDRLGYALALNTQFLAMGSLNAYLNNITNHGAAYIFRIQAYRSYLPIVMKDYTGIAE